MSSDGSENNSYDSSGEYMVVVLVVVLVASHSTKSGASFDVIERTLCHFPLWLRPGAPALPLPPLRKGLPLPLPVIF